MLAGLQPNVRGRIRLEDGFVRLNAPLEPVELVLIREQLDGIAAESPKRDPIATLDQREREVALDGDPDPRLARVRNAYDDRQAVLVEVRGDFELGLCEDLACFHPCAPLRSPASRLLTEMIASGRRPSTVPGKTAIPTVPARRLPAEAGD